MKAGGGSAHDGHGGRTRYQSRRPLPEGVHGYFGDIVR